MQTELSPLERSVLLATLNGQTAAQIAQEKQLAPKAAVSYTHLRKMRQSCRSQLSLATCSTVMLGTLLISSNQNYTLEPVSYTHLALTGSSSANSMRLTMAGSTTNSGR